MTKKKLLISIIASVMVLLLITAAYASLDWYYYHNERFGYELEYPGNIFYMEEGYEDVRSEGILFNSNDYKASIWVEATLNPTSVSLDSIYKKKVNEYRNMGADITYKKLGDDWFALSGFEPGGYIFYVKHISALSGGNDVIDVNFTISYPESERYPYDGIVEHLVDTFKIIDYYIEDDGCDGGG